VIAKNLPEITAIFQEQNPLGRPGYIVRRSVNLERDDLRGIGIQSWRLSTHSRKSMSRTGALGPPTSDRRLVFYQLASALACSGPSQLSIVAAAQLGESLSN
jgi:hypothetical protein